MGVRSGPKIPTRGPEFNVLGAAGEFDSTTGWAATNTLGSSNSWGISGGVASINGTQSSTTHLYRSSSPFIENSYYKITLTITAYTAGTLNISFHTGSAASGTNMTAVGTYSFVGQCTGNNAIYIAADASFNGSIDNYSAVKVESDGSYISPLILSLDSTGGYKTGPELLTSGTSGQRAATYGYHQSGDIFDNATMTGFHAKHASSGQANAGSPVTLPLVLGKTYRVRFDCNIISGTGEGRPRCFLARHYNYGSIAHASYVNRYKNGNGSGGDPTYTDSCVQGKNEYILTVTTDPTWGNSCIMFVTEGAVEYTISNMSVKELFPYNDLSGKGNTGAPQADAILAAEGYVSTTVWPDPATPRYIWDFDGTGDYINCGNDSSLNFGTGDFTIGFWINVAAWVGNWAWLIGKAPGYSGMFIALTSPGYFRASLGAWFTDVIGAYNSEPAISFGTWYHFTLRRAGGSVTAYLNGNQYGTPVANTYDLGTESANNFAIGLGPDSTAVVNGQMAAVQAYKAGLTHAQIKDIYNSQRSRFGL